MSPYIYSLQDDQLRRMTETPYSSEDLLQRLLENHPELLAGEQIDDAEPRRWLLAAREAPVPDAPSATDRWSIDHLFLDQDGTPTIVEVKRSSDARIRREVVGQILEYAANAVAHWPANRIRAEFEKRCTVDRLDADEELRRFLGIATPGEDEVADSVELSEGDNGSAEIEEWWDGVETKLRAGSLRLLFVADVLPPELCRVIEFLNDQMSRTEVLGVEIRQYRDVDGHAQTLVPTVRGKSARKEKKTSAGPKGLRPRITPEDFLAKLEETEEGRAVSPLASRLIALTRRLGGTPCGRGNEREARYNFWFDCDGKRRYPIVIQSNGILSLQMYDMRIYPPFDTAEARDAIRERCEPIAGWGLRGAGMEGYPRFVLREVVEARAEDAFLAAMEWYLRSVRDQRLAAK